MLNLIARDLEACRHVAIEALTGGLDGDRPGVHGTRSRFQRAFVKFLSGRAQKRPDGKTLALENYATQPGSWRRSPSKGSPTFRPSASGAGRSRPTPAHGPTRIGLPLASTVCQ